MIDDNVTQKTRDELVDNKSVGILFKASRFNEPMKNIFNLSIEKGIFPDQLKIARKESICLKVIQDSRFKTHRKCTNKS